MLAVAAIATASMASPVVIQLDEWDGDAAPLPICFPSPLDEPGHVFTLPNLGPGTLRVHVDWDEVPLFLDDLNLFVDRLVNGQWTEVGGDNGNAFPGEAEDSYATVELVNAPAGQYRARVVNCISIATAYHGDASFMTTG